MFKAYGKLEIDDGLRLIIDKDFILYYKWLIVKSFYNTIKVQLPMYDAHSTLINPKIHKNFTYSPALPYIGKFIEFTYNPLNMFESKVNFWLPIQCEIGEKIKKECGVIDDENYWGLHLTICNKKFN